MVVKVSVSQILLSSTLPRIKDKIKQASIVHVSIAS